MAYTTLQGLFTGICDALRTKKGTTDTINHQDIPNEILNLPSGTEYTTDVITKTFAITGIYSSVTNIPKEPVLVIIVMTTLNSTSTGTYNDIVCEVRRKTESGFTSFRLWRDLSYTTDSSSGYDASNQKITLSGLNAGKYEITIVY